MWLHCWSLESLRWRHNGQASVSSHQPHDCLPNRLFWRRSKKTSKLRVTGLCVGNSPGTGEFPAQMASNAENVSIWWLIMWIGHFIPHCMIDVVNYTCRDLRVKLVSLNIIHEIDAGNMDNINKSSFICLHLCKNHLLMIKVGGNICLLNINRKRLWKISGCLNE